MTLTATLANVFRRNPHPLYATFRRIAPVVRLRRGMWAVFDYEHVKRALHDHDAFSSRAAPPGGAPLDWLIFQDPPRHTALRGLITRAFTPRAIGEMEPQVHAIVDELLDDALAAGTMDLVTEFAAQLPLRVIADMMGMPRADMPRLMAWSAAIMQLGDTIYGGERAANAKRAYAACKVDMLPYVRALVVARRTRPGNDLLTRLVHAEVDGTLLSEDDIFSFFQLLLLAGTETTTNLIANAMLCFFAYPDQLALVRATPSLLPAAIEEVLRFRSPVQMAFRATARDVSLRGRVIPGGSLVLAMIGSANRDPRQFHHAQCFDVTRTGVSHVGFGHGAHYCIGAALARLESRIALGALLERAGDIRPVAHRGWIPRPGINIHGPQHLPVRFTIR